MIEVYLFLVKLNKKAKHDAEANRYQYKILETYKKLLAIAASKFCPTLSYVLDHKKNFSQLACLYGVNVVINQAEVVNYREILECILVSMNMSIQISKGSHLEPNRYYICPYISKIMNQYGVKSFDEREIKQINKIEKSLVDYVVKYKLKYIVSLEALPSGEEDIDSGQQLTLDGIDKTIDFTGQSSSEKIKNTRIEYEGRLVLLSVTSGVPSCWSIDNKLIRLTLDAYSQMEVESNIKKYKNRGLLLRMVDNGDGKTVVIIGLA